MSPFLLITFHYIKFMTNFDTPPVTSPVFNVQPTSNTSKPRFSPSLPYTNENLKLINIVNFQFSHLTDTGYITLCSLILKYKTCYATDKNDVGQIATPFRIRLKTNAHLFTQRPFKVTILYRDKVNTFLKGLKNITL